MQIKLLIKNKWAARVLAAVVLAAAVIIVFKWLTGNTVVKEPAAILQRGTIEYIIEADSIIESAQKSEIYAPAGLKVGQVLVCEGERVARGDILAQLDTQALELEIRRAELNIENAEAIMTNELTAQANSIISARNSLSQAQVSLASAQREYDNLLEQAGAEAATNLAAINLDHARRAYEENKALFDQGFIASEIMTQTTDMLERAQTSYDDALRAARESLSQALETLKAARIRQKTAEDVLNDAIEKNTDPAVLALELQKVSLAEKQLRLRDATITAKSAGVVTMVNAKEGAYASGLMFIIENDQELLARARVEETDIATIALGTPCQIRPSGWEHILTGTVTLLPYAAQRDSSGAFLAVVGDDAYFIVEVSIEQTGQSALIGMNAKASFIIESKENCFAVANGLINSDGENTWVLQRARNGKLERIAVQTGLATRRVTEIIADELYEGMEIYSK